MHTSRSSMRRDNTLKLSSRGKNTKFPAYDTKYNEQVYIHSEGQNYDNLYWGSVQFQWSIRHLHSPYHKDTTQAHSYTKKYTGVYITLIQYYLGSFDSLLIHAQLFLNSKCQSSSFCLYLPNIVIKI